MTKPYLTFALTIAFILLFKSLAWTQTTKNDLLINFGASSGYGYPNGLTSTENSGIPTLNLSGEYSLNKLLSFGLYTAYTYSFFKFDDPQVGYKDVWRGWDIGAKSTFHISPFFIKDEKADMYLAVFSGYTTRSLVYDKSNIYRDSLNYNVDAFSYGGILGFRYLITKKIGLYGETGLSRKFFIGGGISFIINTKK